MTPDGPLTELGAGAARALVRDELAGAEPDSVAVVLLHSYRHPQHEQALGEALREELPDVHVSLSHEVVGTFREYERAATTEVDAALSPLLAGYLGQLLERCESEGIPEPSIMQSNGGLIDLGAAARHAAWTVLSGPAGGAAAGAFVARATDQPTFSASTWAGPRATSAWSTAARCGRRAPARSPGARWRCRWWRCTPWAPAAARLPGATQAARSGSGRGRPGRSRVRHVMGGAGPSRPSPTPTWCSATCRRTRRWPVT